MRMLIAALLIAGTASAVDLPHGNVTLPVIGFPVAQPGFCVDGSESLFSSYQAAGLSPVLLYNLPDSNSQGHVWVAVPGSSGYQAVDSYFGPVRDDEFYHADMMFGDVASLHSAFPRGAV